MNSLALAVGECQERRLRLPPTLEARFPGKAFRDFLASQDSLASSELIPRDTQHPHHQDRSSGTLARAVLPRMASTAIPFGMTAALGPTLHLFSTLSREAAGRILSRIRPPPPTTSPNRCVCSPQNPNTTRPRQSGASRSQQRPGANLGQRGTPDSRGASKGTCPRPPSSRRPRLRSGAGPPSRRRGGTARGLPIGSASASRRGRGGARGCGAGKGPGKGGGGAPGAGPGRGPDFPARRPRLPGGDPCSLRS